MPEEKPLQEMTNEELWELFPVILVPHNPKWPERYEAEKKCLQQALGTQIVRIHHIGSTAVEGLTAKPTIDILMEIAPGTDTEALIRQIEELGYLHEPQPGKPAPHMMFMKGYTPQGFRGQTFHLHARYPGDWDEPYFARYLQAHPQRATEYGALKESLLERYRNDRDAYTEAKGEFIRGITRLARETDIDN